MDSRAILSAQGWRGAGHSLHKSDDSIGLAKPLLLSRKDNTQGLGQKQHFTSDQWWMNAFDEQLKGLDTSKQGKVVQTITTGKLNSIEKASLGKWALYASFVRGGLLEGTLSMNSSNDNSSTESEGSKEASDTPQRKQLATSEPAKESSEERRLRKEAKRKRREQRTIGKAARKAKKAANLVLLAPDDGAEEEERKLRAKKEEKRRKKKQKALAGSRD